MFTEGGDGEMLEEGMNVPLFNVQPPLGMSVPTPATAPHAFQPQVRPIAPVATYIGSGAKGPDILSRVLLGLKSGVRSEIDWCLTTLLTFTTAHNPDILQTRQDILELVVDFVVRTWPEVSVERSFDDYDALLLKSKVLEALLVLRNVCIDGATAKMLAPRCAPFVEAGAKLPNLPAFDEMRLLCLEVCEHVCFYFPFDGDSDANLLQSLISLLKESKDKSVLVSALRSVSRLLVLDQRDAAPVLQPATANRVLKFLLIDDAELQTCSLELLQQLTLRFQKVEQLAEFLGGESKLQILLRTLVKLLCFQMQREPLDYLRLPRRTRKLAPVVPPTIPPALMQALLRMPEPERATAWIRASYEMDPEGEVLQVSLWTAYQRLFEPHERDGTGHRMLKAIDFIRTCTTNIRGAQAKVISTPEGPKKFIIKGLVPRETALQLDVPEQNGGRQNRAPPVFGEVAALCLLNIARIQGGKQLLEPLIAEIFDSALVNTLVFEKVDLLLSEIAA